MTQLFENTTVSGYQTKFFEAIQNFGVGGATNIYSLQFWKGICNSQFRGFSDLSANYGTFLPTYVKWRFTFKPEFKSNNLTNAGTNINLSNVYFFVWAGVNQYTISNQDTVSGAITKAIFELPGFKKKPLMSNKTHWPVAYADTDNYSHNIISRMQNPSIAGAYNLRKMAGPAWRNLSQYMNEMNHDGGSFTFPTTDIDYHKFLHVGVVVDDTAYNNLNVEIPAGNIGLFTASCKVYGVASNRRARIQW